MGEMTNLVTNPQRTIITPPGFYHFSVHCFGFTVLLGSLSPLITLLVTAGSCFQEKPTINCILYAISLAPNSWQSQRLAWWSIKQCQETKMALKEERILDSHSPGDQKSWLQTLFCVWMCQVRYNNLWVLVICRCQKKKITFAASKVVNSKHMWVMVQ